MEPLALYGRLQRVPPHELILHDRTYLCSGTRGAVFLVSVFQQRLVLKIADDSYESRHEVEIHSRITADLANGTAPPLFPWLYKWYLVGTEVYMLMSMESTTTLHDYKISPWQDMELFWRKVLREIAMAIDYLETTHRSNHNDLLFKNVVIDPSTLELKLLDFGSASNVNFQLGKDLNYFLYIVIHVLQPVGLFPQTLVDLLAPLIVFVDLPASDGMDDFEWNVTRASCSNPATSGRALKALLTSRSFRNDPDAVVVRQQQAVEPEVLIDQAKCRLAVLVGDALGAPAHLDLNNYKVIKFMDEPDRYKGAYSGFGFNAGTMTDSGHLFVVLDEYYHKYGGKLVAGVVLDTMRSWFAEKSRIVVKDPFVDEFFRLKRKLPCSPTCLVRYLPIVLARMGKCGGVVGEEWRSLASIEEDTVALAREFEATETAVVAACFVNKLVWLMWKTRGPLTDYVTEAFSTTPSGFQEHVLAYSSARAGSLNVSVAIEDCLKNMLWCLHSSRSVHDAMLAAVNIRGYTASMGAVVGVLAVLLYRSDLPVDWVTVFKSKNPTNCVMGMLQCKN